MYNISTVLFYKCGSWQSSICAYWVIIHDSNGLYIQQSQCPKIYVAAFDIGNMQNVTPPHTLPTLFFIIQYIIHYPVTDYLAFNIKPAFLSDSEPEQIMLCKKRRLIKNYMIIRHFLMWHTLSPKLPDNQYTGIHLAHEQLCII